MYSGSHPIFYGPEGFKPYSHEAVVAYAAEKRLLNEKDIINLDWYLEKRNDINYREQKVIIEEAKQIITFAKEVLSKLKNAKNH